MRVLGSNNDFDIDDLNETEEKEQFKLDPEQWGSAKIADVTPDGKLIRIRRLVTKKDIELVKAYMYFLEAQFQHYDMSVQEEITSRYLAKKSKEEKLYKEQEQRANKMKAEMHQKYLKKLSER